MEIMEFLESVAHQIHDLEDNAKIMLAEGKNTEYIKIMQEKAQTLESLALEAKKYPMTSLSAKAQHFTVQNLNQFSASAKNAIHVKSPWYMSQLLFDEDYTEGAPNNFDIFLEDLKAING